MKGKRCSITFPVEVHCFTVLWSTRPTPSKKCDMYGCEVNGAGSGPRLNQFLICSYSPGLLCDEAVGNCGRQYACHRHMNKAKPSQLHCCQPVYLLTTAFSLLTVLVTCDNTVLTTYPGIKAAANHCFSHPHGARNEWKCFICVEMYLIKNLLDSYKAAHCYSTFIIWHLLLSHCKWYQADWNISVQCLYIDKGFYCSIWLVPSWTLAVGYWQRWRKALLTGFGKQWSFFIFPLLRQMLSSCIFSYIR